MTNSPYIYNLGLAFEKVASAQPESPALRFPDDLAVVSYGELNARANQFACWLRGRGFRRCDVVAIFNEKTADAFALMLACLKSGIIYTNLDVESPLPRLERMLAASCPVQFFASGDQLRRVDAALKSAGVSAVAMDEEGFLAELSDASGENEKAVAEICGNNPAYLMFTSGSTGFPKGAVMTHANVLNLVQWSRARLGISSKDNLTNVNPIHFDNSVFDFYAALFNGAALTPFTARWTQNPRNLVKAVDAVGCTVWFSVPSLLVYGITLRAFLPDDFASLRLIVFGGEGFPKPQLKKLFDLFGGRIGFENVYGPTECTCICSAYRVTASDFESLDGLLPLGRMAENFGWRILVAEDREAGPGETGELCLTGPNVGLGYYRDPERTTAAFVANPFHPHIEDRMYRTGDLVRFDPASGLIHICGRIDNQVKLMGHRIELEEIELAANRHAGVAECGAVLRRSSGGRDEIAAFVAIQEEISEVDLLAGLRQRLPHYMIPAHFELMKELPKNSNGKIDRQRLRQLANGQE